MTTLLQAGQPEAIAKSCDNLGFGRNDDAFFQFHSSYLAELPILLRVYIGCGSVLYGAMGEADIIKIHKWTKKISLMFYDDFWKNAHPQLQLRIKLLLRTQEIEVYDYSTEESIPLLFEKDSFLGSEHKKHRLFSRLTKQEREAGLLEFEGYGPDQDTWERMLASLIIPDIDLRQIGPRSGGYLPSIESCSCRDGSIIAVAVRPHISSSTCS